MNAVGQVFVSEDPSAFLDQLGRTDMAQLSRVEWAEFCDANHGTGGAW